MLVFGKDFASSLFKILSGKFSVNSAIFFKGLLIKRLILKANNNPTKQIKNITDIFWI